MIFFSFLYSGITDLALGISDMLIHVCFRDVLQHSHKKRIAWKHGAELAFLRTYVESQAILEPILLYRASKCKQTKEQGSEDCLWTHIFTFL